VAADLLEVSPYLHRCHPSFKPMPNSFTLPTVAWRLFAIGWAAHIFFMSTSSFGGAQSRSYLEGFLRLCSIGVSEPTLEVLNAISRKMAHLTEYATLSVLLYNSFRSVACTRTKLQIAIWCVAACAVYALTDEFHQLFVKGRHASLIDCAIDTAGAVMAMTFVYHLPRLKQRDYSS
jgi:VanZ family protein